MLSHLASRVFGTPLLVHRAKLAIILAVMGERLGIAPPVVDLTLPSAKLSTAVPTVMPRASGATVSPRSPVTWA